MKKIGVIDLGSNSARLTVAEIIGDDFNTVFSDNIYVRLAEGMTDSNNTLKPEPALRAVLALSEFIKKCGDLSCDEVSVIATEAVRRADNSEWFLSLVKSAVGVDIDVISGSDEAYYDCLSIMHKTGFREFVMIDTGGGSTEIAYVNGGEVKNRVSAPWGSVVLNRMFSSGETLSPKEFNDVIAHISDGFASLDWIFGIKNVPIIMLGGSLRNWYDYKKDYTLSQFADKMLSMTVSEREDFGIPKRRSDTITAGLAPAIVLELIIKPSEFTACDCGVKEGYIINKIRGK